jgi:hypothetical protein
MCNQNCEKIKDGTIKYCCQCPEVCGKIVCKQFSKEFTGELRRKFEKVECNKLENAKNRAAILYKELTGKEVSERDMKKVLKELGL